MPLNLLRRWLARKNVSDRSNVDQPGERAPAPLVAPPGKGLRDGTLVITHAEVCRRHGAGALLMKIFAKDPSLMVLYSRNYFDGECFGHVTAHLPHPTLDLKESKARLAPVLAGRDIQRIFCVPFYPDDAVSGVAAAELTGAPLVTYIMDDQNVFTTGIPDGLMERLVDRSALLFAISEVLRAGYQKKYGKPCWIIPPVNEAHLFAPTDYLGPGNQPPRGVIIGNVWSSEVLQSLRDTVKASGLAVDWYGNAGKPFIQLDEVELAAEGIVLHPNLTDEPLVQALRECDYGIMPSGTLSANLEHDWLFRASLPSRLIYLLTTAHLPLIVLGDPETAAAQFVTRLGLGTTAPYEAERFSAAVTDVTSPGRQRQIRAAAAALAPAFVSEPVAAFVWKSVEKGRPLDERYEVLFADPLPSPHCR
ncbi:MAG TPA: hypothetical protein VGD78_07460 [Chthoniobacterales bacterium]